MTKLTSLTSPVYCVSDAFSFLSRFFLLDFLKLLSSAESYSFLLIYFLQFMLSDESDSLDDESDNNGSDSGFAGMCYFPFCFEDYVGSVGDSIGRVCGVGSGIFVPIVIESNCDVVPFVVFVPIVVESKIVRLIEIYGAQSPDFPSKFQNQFYSYSLVLNLAQSFQPLLLCQKYDPAQTNGIHLSFL